jgi:3-isopropylmalate dehydrogenase/3-benzylmalate dehydrogenase
MRRTWRVAALPGEGIGPEVIEPTLEVLGRAAELGGASLRVERALFGKPAHDVHGSHFPAETAEVCRAADGILLGAVQKGGLLELRSHFDFFANLRPVRAVDCLLGASSLRPQKVEGLDLLFVRELTSGLPFGDAGRGEDARGPFGFHTMRYHDYQIRRIARVALQHASRRRGLVTVAHKENALPCIPWCDLVGEEAAAFPDVRVETMLVDNLSMQLVMNPLRFDVILAENLMGDWMSSLGAALVGSIGLLPSASLNADGFGLYEPIHGTAPEIVGQGIANPLGAIGSAVLMLRQWGEVAAADRIAGAVDRVLADGYRTPDLGATAEARQVSTRGMTDAILAALERLAPDARIGS